MPVVRVDAVVLVMMVYLAAQLVRLTLVPLAVLEAVVPRVVVAALVDWQLPTVCTAAAGSPY